MKTQLQNSKEILKDFYRRPGHYWQRQQEKLSLELFNKAAKSVKAYHNFLSLNAVKKSDIKTFSDFQNLLPVSKKNYFQKYTLKDLTWPKAYETGALVMTATSGSTGRPTYFPREELLDWQYSVWAENFLRNGPKGNTLLLDCFGMGVWIGGIITYQAFYNCAKRGYPVTIITPGINKKEIFHALRELAPNFQNIILAGYPPFLKDVIDEAREEKINLKKLRFRLVFAAESFSESFREHLTENVGIKDLYHNTMNIYGSAELGAMAVETPTSILVRRLALKNPDIYNKLFTPGKLPTLAQYCPIFGNFEEQNGQILITAQTTCPLLRYQIGDNGATFNFDAINRIFSAGGVNLQLVANKLKIRLSCLPFVAVYERSDFSTKLYGAIIYPEHIRTALQNKLLLNSVSGKFAMFTKVDKKHNQLLEINIELKRNQKPDKKLEKLCRELIVKNLLLKNAEYKNNYQIIPKKITPLILLCRHGDPRYFLSGIKQKWIIK